MSIPSNVILGELILKNLPDGFCFTDAKDFVAQLPNLLGVEIPGTVTNVVVSNVEPTSSQTTALWVRLSNSGSFLGLYVFASAQWHQVYPIQDSHVNQIFWLTSDDASVPEGFQKVTLASTDVPPDTIPFIMSQYVQDSGGNDIYFAATYVGF